MAWYTKKTDWTSVDGVSNTDVNKWENGIGDANNEAAATPGTLVYGLNALTNVPTQTPYNVLMQGRTLVNLPGRDGNCEDVSKWTTSNSTTSLDSGNKVYGSNSIKVTISASTGSIYKLADSLLNNSKYYVFIVEAKNGNASNIQVGHFNGSSVRLGNLVTSTSVFSLSYIKIQPSNIGASGNQLVAYVNGSSGQFVYLDGIRLYEITASDYTAIDSMTAQQIADKWPYVDDMKPVTNPYVIKYGKNLLPQFSEITFTDSTGVSVTEAYKLDVTRGSSGNIGYFELSVIPNTTYNLSFSNITGVCSVQDSTGSTIVGGMSYSSTASRSFNTGSNSVVRVYFRANAAGSYTFDRPQLELGSAATTFTARNDDYLFFPSLTLASSVDGLIYDTLSRRDGKWFKHSRFKTMDLDGSLSWTFFLDSTGYKSVKVDVSNASDRKFIVSKYDGKILAQETSFTKSDSSDIVSGYLYVSISDTDSGWGESYTPSAAEIQAYFYGWKMNNGVFGTPYNGSGTKTWTGFDATSNTNAVTTVPATRNGWPGWSPYRLQYQLATPVTESVDYEGKLTLHEGGNQIEVGNGMIVRERVTPVLDSGTYYFNNTYGTRGASKFQNRTSKIISIYKNGNIEKKWVRYPDSASYGLESAYIKAADFDPTATYEVTYLALDQYALTANVVTVTTERWDNVGSTAAKATQNVADLAQDFTGWKAFLWAFLNNTFAKKAGDVMTALNDFYVKATSSSANANVWFRDENGNSQAVVYMNRSDGNKVYVSDPSGTGRIIKASGDTMTGVLNNTAGYQWGGTTMAQTRLNGGVLEYNDSGTWKAAGGVKSVQRGVTTVGSGGAVDVTISAINMNKAFVNFNTDAFGSPGSGSVAQVSAYLTSSTNLHLVCTYSSFDIRWEVVEFY